jgi:hypothetical protein
LTAKTILIIFVGMKEPKKIFTKGLQNHQINSELIEILNAKLGVNYSAYMHIIDKYLYEKSKIDELENRLTSNLHYKITLLNNKYSGKVINVRLILPFVKNENKNSIYPYFNLHIGKLSNYKLGLEDPQITIDVENKIKEFITQRYPFRVLVADNQEIGMKY